MKYRMLLGALAVTALVQFASASRLEVQCAEWSEGLGVPGVAGRVHAFARWDDGTGPALYAGGLFGAAEDAGALNVARWDGARWSPLGRGIDGRVLALVGFDDGSGPALYAAGGFGQAGDVLAIDIARWDGSTWAAVGSGLDPGTVPVAQALAVFDDGSGPALYAGGNFATAGGLSVGGVARWDGMAWSQVGGGTDGHIEALAVFDDGQGEALYAAGRFVHAGGLVVNHVARWDGTSWSSLAAGVSLGPVDAVRALEVFDDGSGPALYLGGTFSIGAIDNVARWSGTSWQAVGDSLGSFVYSLEVFDEGAGATLYAAGSYIHSGSHVARLGKTAWSGLGFPAQQTGGVDRVYAMSSFDAGPDGNPALMVGGEFQALVPQLAVGVAAWEGSVWRGFGSKQQGLSDAGALAVFDDGSGPDLYAAGPAYAGGVEVGGFARWTGDGWESVPGAADALQYQSVVDMEVHHGPRGVPPGLYLLDYDSLLRWDGRLWSDPMDFPGTSDGDASTLELYEGALGDGPHVFVGGDLGTPAGQLGVVEWDGASWSAPGGGLTGNVRALAVFDDGTGPALFAGGDITEPFHGIARWDGSSWSPVGSWPIASVYCLAVYDEGTGPALYAGGELGYPYDGIARWDGTAWSSVGGGVSGTQYPRVTALSVHEGPGGAVLIATGSFSSAGGQPAENIAQWDGAGWLSLGAGLGGPGSHMLSWNDGTGSSLWVCGGFASAGPHASWHVARWRDGANAPVTYCTGKTNSLGCVPFISSTGTPSITMSSPFRVDGSDLVPSQTTQLLYSLAGRSHLAFHGGTLCVKAPFTRLLTVKQAGAGGTAPCSGTTSRNFNNRIQSGVDPGLTAGQRVTAQYRQRDPDLGDGFNDTLTNGLEFRICP